MGESSMTEAFVTLVVSVLIIGVLLYLVRKYANNIKSSSNQVEINVISKISLMPKHHLFVIKAGSKKLLVGVSEKGITPIADLTKALNDDKEASKVKEALKIRKGDFNEESLSFSSFIKSAFNRKAV